jgi:NADH dehydrogenase
MAGTITVFGGTGFIGRHLVALLLRTGKMVRMAVRYPGRVKTPAEATNSPEIVQADMLDDTSVGSAIMGAHAVFNLVGILTETSTQTYRAIHVEGARRVALAAQNHGVMRVIHMSALGASPTSPAISDRPLAGSALGGASSPWRTCNGRFVTHLLRPQCPLRVRP